MAFRSLLPSGLANAPTDSSSEEFFDAPASFDANAPAMPRTYNRVRDPSAADWVPDADLSLIKLAKEVLGSVKSGADVTNVNLPASVLDPVSTLEKATKSMQMGDLLPDIVLSPDPLERFFAVIRFCLSGLAKEKFGKKPYNPVLGEVFRCAFAHRDRSHGATVLVVEQVSHHPPITALHLNNPTLGFAMNSYTAPEPRFWGNSLEVKLKGCIRIALARHPGEEYRLTRPVLYMSGFFAGRQRLEFTGPAEIVCEKTGLAAELDFKSKGVLARGEPHGIAGRIYDLRTGETKFTFDGHWDSLVKMTDVRTRKTRTLFDHTAMKKVKCMFPILPDVDELEESFSTRIWAECSDAIWRSNTADANAAKRKVEDAQRALKKARAENGTPWSHHYFRKRTDGLDGYVLQERHEGRLAPTFGLSASCLDAAREANIAGVDTAFCETVRVSDAASSGNGVPNGTSAADGNHPEKVKTKRRLGGLTKSRFTGAAAGK